MINIYIIVYKYLLSSCSLGQAIIPGSLVVVQLIPWIKDLVECQDLHYIDGKETLLIFPFNAWLLVDVISIIRVAQWAKTKTKKLSSPKRKEIENSAGDGGDLLLRSINQSGYRLHPPLIPRYHPISLLLVTHIPTI
ncbi:hypothetical protein QVD17_05065 [Tagetes erecta]|uniref:Uncharacterized protein n=1 Tax=Tagetes erecta TaxID=13708 RepID=A0AAD8PAW7_TARER|nr:hypothetical protein QVD17_05065 [Tagetes erecta]